jgi:miniconductance mechanosensitive channel
MMKAWLQQLSVSLNIPTSLVPIYEISLEIALVLLLAWIINWLAKRLILRGVGVLVRLTESHWDDLLQSHGVFSRLASFAPVIVLYLSADLVFGSATSSGAWVERIALILIVLLSVRILDALISVLLEYFQDFDFSKQRPVRGYAQIAVLAIYLVGGIFVLSILLQKEPWGLLTGLGAMSAVLLLVFKDTILGLVASVQITANDMLRRGDWIEMPQKGADGDVLDISLHTVKVQNWDKTISTIPTQALINESFKNWRGMSEAGGRRIKRQIHIDQNSIRFCDQAMFDRWRGSKIIGSYLEKKMAEIESYNLDKNLTAPLDSRHLTNIGTFRAYIEVYLRAHPKINQQMTLLVRQLQPTAAGLPMEIYCFSVVKEWAQYEAIQADIMDHILSVLGEFDLRVFQFPAHFSEASSRP